MSLTGVAALADRPVDGRRVARVMGGAALVLSVISLAGVELLLATANAEPDASVALRLGEGSAALDPPAGPPSRVALLLVDGLRDDEARALPSLRRFEPVAWRGVLDVPSPTLSRPFEHRLFTGVPSHVSGVRTNRFRAPARHDTVAGRVRDAGGRVFIIADGLNWIRRMIGRPEDGGDDAPDAFARIDAVLSEFAAAPPPALLIIHATATDGTAHAGDVAGHRAALGEADALISRLAVEPATLVVLSDHGHIAGGGHGGLEPEVARAPLVILPPPDARRAVLARDLGLVDAHRVAPTLSSLLGAPAPRSAFGSPLDLESRGSDAAPRRPASAERARAIVRRAEREGVVLRTIGRRTLWLLALLASVMTLGPIKRAYGFDRSTPLAMALWPTLVVAGHLGLGRPLSLSAIDGEVTHALRVAALGLVSAALAFAAARLVARRGDTAERERRALGTVGWSVVAAALVSVAQAGGSLATEPLGPRALYLPLLSLGAAGPALAFIGLALLGSSARRAASVVASPLTSDGREPGSAAPPTA